MAHARKPQRFLSQPFFVLAHRAAMVTALGGGTLTVRYADGKEGRWPLKGGLFEVSNNRAAVLADAITMTAVATCSGRRPPRWPVCERGLSLTSRHQLGL